MSLMSGVLNPVVLRLTLRATMGRKRALIFAPLMFLTIRLLEPKDAIGASILRTVFLLALFLPFSYVTDSMLYRSHVRRTTASRDKEKKS